MDTTRRTDDTLARRYGGRLMAGPRLMGAAAAFSIAAAAVAITGQTALGGVEAKYIIAGAAGAAFLFVAAGLVLQILALRHLGKEILDPVDEMSSRLRKMIIAGVTDVKPLGPGAATEVRDVWGNYQKLAIALEREKKKGQVALDSTQAGKQAALDAALQAVAEKEKGETDPLTKLFNRRRLDADLERDVEHAVNGGGPSFAFVMVDVDHFKSFNDNYGHQKGDEILQGLAAILKESVRGLDGAYRYGGEEFSLILRNITAPTAYEVVERIRAKVEKVFAATDTPMTASFGVSIAPHCATTVLEVISAADAALYESKEGGRNRVTLAPPAPIAAAPPAPAPAPAPAPVAPAPAAPAPAAPAAAAPPAPTPAAASQKPSA